MRGWWFWEWGKGEKRGGEADWAAPRPASSLGAKCPGLAEKGVNTSSLHHPHRRRLPPSLPAIQRTPTRLAEGTEADHAHQQRRRGAKPNPPGRPDSCLQRGGIARAALAGATPREPPRQRPRPAVPELGHRDPVLPVATPSSGFRGGRPRASGRAGRCVANSEGLPGCRDRPAASSTLDAPTALLIATLG